MMDWAALNVETKLTTRPGRHSPLCLGLPYGSTAARRTSQANIGAGSDNGLEFGKLSDLDPRPYSSLTEVLGSERGVQRS